MDARIKSARHKRPAGALPSSTLLKSICALLLALMLCLMSVGDSLLAQENDRADVIAVRTDLITVPVIVKDSRGHRVVGLTKGDFRLDVEGRVHEISFFATGTSRLAMTFLIDTSGSAREYLREEREAALSLLSHFGSKSEVSVVQFNDSPTLVVPFSVNMQEARKGFDLPSISSKHTAIFNAAMAALHLINQRKIDPTERRIVILTSDGLDTASTVKASEVIDYARKSAVSLYVIHFPLFTPQGDRLAPRRAANGFRDLAEKTGGQYFIVGDAESALIGHRKNDLSRVFQMIEEDLAGQYLLGFYADQRYRDGDTHRLKVSSITRARGYRVTTLREISPRRPSVRKASP